METTISTHNGSAVCRNHNIRDERVVSKADHIDPNGVCEIWRDELPKAAYKRLFGESVKAYNQAQKSKGHAERQIKSYMRKIEQDPVKHSVYEMIVQVGSKERPIDEALAKSILKEWVDGWEKRNPGLELIGVYYHADELGCPHIHADYIPVARGCTRGPETQNNLTKALEAGGFKSANHKNTAQIQWEKRENAVLEKLCQNRGIAVLHPMRDGKGRAHLSTPEYKALQEELAQGRQENAQLRAENAQLESEMESVERRMYELQQLLQEMAARHSYPGRERRKPMSKDTEWVQSIPEKERLERELAAAQNAPAALAKAQAILSESVQGQHIKRLEQTIRELRSKTGLDHILDGMDAQELRQELNAAKELMTPEQLEVLEMIMFAKTEPQDALDAPQRPKSAWDELGI